ncbi:MAG TPA: hypothetical protein VKA81_11345 [Verrucomicrobiae bacterium]|nr:hypothetical protein [Verrucomicrobiae bacterium]
MNNLSLLRFIAGLLGLAWAATIEIHAASTVQAISLADSSLPVAAGGNSDSSGSVISSDGRFVLFLSSANNLVTNDDNGRFVDVFLRNRTNGVTTLVSVNQTGVGGGNGNSVSPVISTDGRYVVFESEASNLVTNDTNGVSDVFVRDLQTGTTTFVSVNSAGAAGNGASTSPLISPDGRYVTFVSAAGDLVANDTNNATDIFVRDLQSHTTTLVSVSTDGATSGNGASDSPTMTPDGRWVAFMSKAANLVAGATNNLGDIYARDLVSGTTVWVGTNVAAIMSGVNSQSHPINSYNPVVSDNGNYVAFKSIGAAQLVLRHNLQTGATDLVSTNTVGNTIGFDDPSGPDMTPDGRFIAYTEARGAGGMGSTDVYLWDAQNGTSSLVSANLSGTISSNTFSDTPAVSADGRFVTFVSDASDLTTNAMDGSYQVYVRHVLNGTTKLVSADTRGGVSGDTGGAIPTMTADGRYVAFDSFDGDYVPNDNNAAYDVFVRDTTADTTELISQSDPTVPSLTADGLSSVGANSLSADGRFVAFVSLADNLVANDSNDNQDVFVRDLQSGTNILASVNGAGTGSANGFSGSPAISAEGRFVAFVSDAGDLSPNQTNRTANIYLRDLQSGTTQLVSVSTNGTGGNAASSAPAIDSGGRHVAFVSQASNLIPNDANNSSDVFWRDLQTGTTVSVTPAGRALAFSMSADGRRVACIAGLQPQMLVWDSQSQTAVYSNTTASISALTLSADGNFVVYQAGSQLFGHDLKSNIDLTIGMTVPFGKMSPQISSNGRFIVYVSGASNVVANDTNNTADVFLYDLQTATTTLISFNQDRTGSGDGPSDSPSISADGRFVTYRSSADDLVAGDNNGQPDAFVFDRLTGTNTVVSVSQSGTASGNDRSTGPTISTDGTTIVFRSVASDLIAGDFNNTQDVFLFRVPTNPMNAASKFSAQASVLPGANQVAITWESVPGWSYQVQYKTDLSETNWSDLPGGVAVNGSRGASVDSTVIGSSQRFYRVKLVE